MGIDQGAADAPSYLWADLMTADSAEACLWTIGKDGRAYPVHVDQSHAGQPGTAVEWPPLVGDKVAPLSKKSQHCPIVEPEADLASKSLDEHVAVNSRDTVTRICLP
jgi:hypothetical protein